MSITDGLLKLDGSDGSLKKMTASEENYLAHQAGLQLADAGVGEVASITTTSSGNATVGTYTNTTMDGNVGDHDASARNVTTTNTTIYQKEGTAATSGGSYFQPVIFDKSDTKTIKVVNDTEMNVVVDRLLLTIFANDYAGTYKLGSSAPSGDYSVHISNVFADTRADGTTVNYNIYKRDTFSEPTKISPMRLLNSSGDLQAMTPAQIKYTFGQVAKTRIMNGSAGVGTYQLRSSAQGVPTDSGTWVAKGTATDIRNTLADQNYTRDSTSNFEGNYEGAFGGDYTGNYDGNYSGAHFDGDYATFYAGQYTGDYQLIDVDGFLGNYSSEANYIGTYQPDYVADYVGDYLGTFLGDYEVEYTGEFTRVSQVVFGAGSHSDGASWGDATVDYTGNYEGGYLGDYEGNYDSSEYGRDYEGAFYLGDFEGNYDGGADYLGNYSGDYESNYQAVYDGNYNVAYTGDYEPHYQGMFTGEYIGDYARDFVGDYTGNFVGNYSGSTIQSGVQTIETYTLYVRTA
mgnify:FL=1